MKDLLLKGINLTEEERLVLDTVRNLCRKELAPRAAEIDEAERFPWENIQKINEVGLNGLFIPEEYGGNPVSKTAWVVILKEMSKACPATGIIFATTSHAATPIVQCGTHGQKQQFLARFLEGAVGGISMSESNAGSDVRAMRAQAEKTAGGYRLNGSKVFVTSGDVADVFVVFAKLKEGDKIVGMSPFIVTKDAPGLRVGKKERKMGIRGSSTAELSLEDCEIPADRLLGEPGDGFAVMLGFLNESRPNIAAQAVGVAEAAFEAAVEYINQRMQFGKRIIDNQGIQFMVAEMATQIAAAWNLVTHVTQMMDAGMEGLSVEASMAKLFASEVAERVASNAVQLHGGYGYCRDYPVERLFRDSKITQIYEGTSQIQKILIGRNFMEKK